MLDRVGSRQGQPGSLVGARIAMSEIADFATLVLIVAGGFSVAAISTKLTERFPGAWANEWLPENEFGHWDGLRLRRTRARYAIQMPKAAMDLDRGGVTEPTQVQPQPSQG